MAPQADAQRFDVPTGLGVVLAESATRAIRAITGLLDGMADGRAQFERLYDVLGISVPTGVRRAWCISDEVISDLDAFRGPLADLVLAATELELSARADLDVEPPPVPAPPGLWPTPKHDPAALSVTVAAQTSWAFGLLHSRGQEVKRRLIVLERLCAQEPGALAQLAARARSLVDDL